MNHIENDIPDTVDQIQPDNHQSGQMAHDSKMTTLFASLQPQDVEQFYQSYQLWCITVRIQALQTEIEQVQQEQAANARLLEQYQPSPIAQAVLAQLQAHDVGDLDLLDQMLQRGDDWLDHTMQLLEQCEQLDIIHGNYTEWCIHALEGAYDWIGSMHEHDTAEEPEEPAATTEVFDESTEQLLLQKLLSDEEEIVVPATIEEPAEVEPISEEVITPEDAPAAQEETLQITDDDIVVTAESDAPVEEDTEAEEDATNSEISETIDIPEQENTLEDDAEASAQETSPAIDSDSHAALEADISPSSDTFDEVEASVVERESATTDETVESNSEAEEVEILEASAVQAPIEDQDEVVEPTEDEQTDAEVFTESADEEAVAEILEQDTTEASDEQELQVESLAEIAELTEVEDRANDSEEVPTEEVGEASAEPTSQEIAPDADEAKSIISSIIPAAEEQLEDNVVTNDVEAEYDVVAEVAPEQVEAEYDAVAEVIPEQVTEEASGDEETDDAESNAAPNHEYAYTAEEDTIAIPKIFFPTGRVTPLKAVAEIETQATMPISIQETPAITLSAEGNTPAPSTRPLPDIYGETNKQPAIAPTPAPIWHEESDAHVSSSLPQVSSPLLPEPHQGFFRRLWLKFLAWLRGE